MAETGQRVGDYEVLAQLGAGGMGRVFRVRNVISGREEAMKILLPDLASDSDLAARFMAEIRTLAGLEHPGIAQLRTAFQHNNQLVMIMEFVEGITLEKLASEVRIPLDHVVDYAMQSLAALSYAHTRGVIHRDIKPANIMITTHGVVKLMDFGIAKSAEDRQLTRPGSTMGSVYYMAPEQIQGGAVDARTDLYSFGVTLYELITGRKPFQADTSYTILNAQLHQAPTPPIELNPAIPPSLNAIVLQAMAKNPDERFQNAEAFRSALRSVGDGLTAPLPQVAAAPPAQTPAFATAPQFSTADSFAGQSASAASDAPPFTPVAMPAPMPVATAGPRRGLWIGLGAFIAVAALVAVAWVLPRVYSTKASQKPAVVATDVTSPAQAPQTATQPDNPPAAQQPETPQQPAASSPAETGTPSQAQTAASAGTKHAPASASHAAPGGSPASPPRPTYVPPAAPVAANAAPAASDPQPAAGPSPREMREAHDRFALLEGRADAALAGVDQIRSQQRAQGLDLRGDIIAAVNRLHNQLDMARQALAQKDLDTANDYMNRADNDTGRLEKFLGR